MLELLKEKRRFVLAAVIYAFFYFVFGLVVTEVLKLFPSLVETTNGTTGLTAGGAALQNIINYLLLVTGILVVIKNDIFGDFKTFFAKRKHSIGLVVLIGFGFIVVNIITGQLVTLLNNALDVAPSVNQSLVGILLQSEFGLPFAFVAVVLGPVVEEMIFRKTLFQLIQSPIVAVIVSAFLFAIIHVGAEPSFIAFLVNSVGYFIPGLVFGLLYLRYQKNIAPLMVIHIINNLVSILLTLLQLSIAE
jgi:membrane protease YdiL (CAAX protease family)